MMTKEQAKEAAIELANSKALDNLTNPTITWDDFITALRDKTNRANAEYEKRLSLWRRNKDTGYPDSERTRADILNEIVQLWESINNPKTNS